MRSAPFIPNIISLRASFHLLLNRRLMPRKDHMRRRSREGRSGLGPKISSSPRRISLDNCLVVNPKCRTDISIEAEVRCWCRTTRGSSVRPSICALIAEPFALLITVILACHDKPAAELVSGEGSGWCFFFSLFHLQALLYFVRSVFSSLSYYISRAKMSNTGS